MKTHNHFLLFYLLLCLFFFSINIVSFFSFSMAYVFSKYFTLIFIIVLILRSFKKNGIMSIYSLFLSFCLFFLYMRIFFDVIGYKSLTFYNFGKSITWSTELIFLFLNYSFIFLIIIDLSYYCSTPRKVQLIENSENKISKITSSLFFLVFSLIFSYKCYLDIQSMHALGYTAIVNNIRVNYPSWTKGAGTCFYVSFYLLLMHKLNKKECITVFIIYLFVSLLSGLKGARAAFFIPFIFSLLYLTEKKYIRINFLGLMFLISLSMLVILIITLSRGEYLGYLNNFGDVLYYVFYNQTQTFNVPIFFLKYRELIQEEVNIPYLFADLVHIYNTKIVDGNTVINIFTGLPEGLSLGNSLFLELLDLPIILSLLFCCIIGYLIKYIQINFLRNRRLIPIHCCLVSSLFYMPRNIFFSFLDLSSIIYITVPNLFFILFIFLVNYGVNSGKKYYE